MGVSIFPLGVDVKSSSTPFASMRGFTPLFGSSSGRSVRNHSNISQLDGVVLGIYKSGELTKDAQKFESIKQTISDKWKGSKKKQGDYLVIPTNSKELPPIVAVVGLGEQGDQIRLIVRFIGSEANCQRSCTYWHLRPEEYFSRQITFPSIYSLFY